MEDTLIYSITFGLAAAGIILLSLTRADQTDTAKKALALVAFAIGFGVAWWFYRHPLDIEQVMSDVVARTVAIVMAFLMAVLIIWKVRSLFR